LPADGTCRTYRYREYLSLAKKISEKSANLSEGRHKADRRVYANSEQIAGLPFWARGKVPALAIHGEHGIRYLLAELAEIRANAPQVTVAQVPASNHHIPLDNPGGFVGVVQRFLRS
jgi:pimeloyl-ACP methyl ester carboxylesterase